MEIVSPIAFLASLPLAQTPTFPSHASGYVAAIRKAFAALPLARQILVAGFVVHYFNRSVVSTLQNPSRARMNILVPVSAVVFNIMNGSTMGIYVAASSSSATGLKSGNEYRALFIAGMAMWLVGFCSNIYHDRVLYALKRDKKNRRDLAKDARANDRDDPKHRYSIPPRDKGLYRYVSHPSYLSEWLEWLGYLVATWALEGTSSPLSSPKTPTAITGGKLALAPLTAWYLVPPALFLWQEIGVMLPRARSGHAWYERTFGRDVWRNQGQRWIVVPGLY
ncbi:hypothetical protein JCM3766R1_003211 [Sporobolomyces carnicolor]